MRLRGTTKFRLGRIGNLIPKAPCVFLAYRGRLQPPGREVHRLAEPVLPAPFRLSILANMPDNLPPELQTSFLGQYGLLIAVVTFAVAAVAYLIRALWQLPEQKPVSVYQSKTASRCWHLLN